MDLGRTVDRVPLIATTEHLPALLFQDEASRDLIRTPEVLETFRCIYEECVEEPDTRSSAQRAGAVQIASLPLKHQVEVGQLPRSERAGMCSSVSARTEYS